MKGRRCQWQVLAFVAEEDIRDGQPLQPRQCSQAAPAGCGRLDRTVEHCQGCQ